jgi:hypothetical protein
MRNVFLLLPCAAVAAGFWLLRSAWAAILLYHAVIIAYLLISRGERPPTRLLGGWSTPARLALSALCACVLPLIVMLWPFINCVPDGLEASLSSFGLSGPALGLFFAYFVIFHPVIEEVFWRGAIDSRLPGLDFADAAFAAYHVLVLAHFLSIPWLVVAFAVLAAVSWLWRLAVRRLEGLMIPAISHIVAGLGIMTAAFMIMRH